MNWTADMALGISGAAWLGAGAVLGGAVLSSNASKSASNAQVGAADRSSQLQNDQYQQTRTDNLPALGARNDALAQLEFELAVGGNPSGKSGYGALAAPLSAGDVMNEPGYQFGLTQGQHTLTNQENARGMGASGAALKAASQYGTDYATTKYDDAFNRAQTSRNAQINPFLSLAGAGQLGSSAIGAAGQNYANQAGANSIYSGQAQAQNNYAQGSIYANAGNQLAGWYQNRNSGTSPSGGSGTFDSSGYPNVGGFPNWGG